MKCVRCDTAGAHADYRACKACVAQLLANDDSPKPIMSNLLCYVSSYLNRASPVKTHVACLKSFADAEITEARDLLFHAYANELGPPPKRAESNKRSKAEIIMEDILKAFNDLDRNHKIHPLCATGDITKMPKYTPEEADVLSLFDKLRQLENRVVDVEKSQQFMSDTNDANSTKVITMESDMIKIKNDTDTALHLAKENHATLAKNNNPNDIKHGHKQINNNFLSGRRDSFDSTNNNRRWSNASQRGGRPPTGFGHGSRFNGATPAVAAAAAAAAANAGSGRPRLGAPPPSRFLVIARVMKDRTTDDVNNYIKDIDSSIEIRSLFKISHDEAPFHKFKLEVSVADYNKVSNRTFWDSGIYCYPFRGRFYRDTYETMS